MQPTREQAWEWLKEYTKSEALRRHALTVEGCMRHFAALAGEDAELWGVVGLLHDLDYEQYPDEHCKKVQEILREKDVDPAIIRAVADGRISRQSAREVFAYAFDGGEDVEGYIKRHGLEMVSDDAAYERVLSEVLAACEKDVAAYRAGNEKVFGFLVGQAMKALRGKADPKKISEMLGKML